MTLQELTLRFQSLCHDGYSLAKVKLKAGDEEFNLAVDEESERENAKLTVLGDDV